MSDNIHLISPDELEFDRLREILYGGLKLGLSEGSIQRVVKCRDYLDRKLVDTRDPLYGINTGFGSLHDRLISKEDLGLLSRPGS